MWESCVSSASSRLSLTLSVVQKKDQKNSSWEGEGINALCQLIGQWVTDSLNRGIDLRKEIDLWLLQMTVQKPILNFFMPLALEQYETLSLTHSSDCPVNWGSRIHQPCLCRGVRHSTPTNECPAYDTKQSDCEVPGMWSTSSLPSLPGPLWPRVVASDRVLSMGQIELNCVLMWNRTVWNKTVFE